MPVISLMALTKRVAVRGVKYTESLELGLGGSYSNPEVSYKEWDQNVSNAFCILSSCIFFMIFTFLLHVLFPPLYPTSSPSFSFHTLTTTRQSNTMVLVQYGLAIRGGLCHRASVSQSLFFFYTSFSLPSIQLSHYPSHFHMLTTNDKTIEHDDIGTIWPSYTWWPKELLDRMLSCPKNIRRSVPHHPLPRRDPSPHQAGDSQEESPRKPMPPLPT